MTVGIVMTVWNIKTTHRQNLLGTVITMPTVITLSLALEQLLSEDIRLTCHVHRARDLRETRIYIIDTVLDNNQLTTNFNTAYVPL